MIDTDFKFGEVHDLDSQVSVSEERVQFKNIFSTPNGGVVLLGMKKGQKLDTHVAPAEVMVMVLAGEIEFTMLDTPHTVRAGKFILMGRDVPHSVVARSDSKIMLVKIKE